VCYIPIKGAGQKSKTLTARATGAAQTEPGIMAYNAGIRLAYMDFIRF
jgi:hypothetical protein